MSSATTPTTSTTTIAITSTSTITITIANEADPQGLTAHSESPPLSPPLQCHEITPLHLGHSAAAAGLSPLSIAVRLRADARLQMCAFRRENAQKFDSIGEVLSCQRARSRGHCGMVKEKASAPPRDSNPRNRATVVMHITVITGVLPMHIPQVGTCNASALRSGLLVAIAAQGNGNLRSGCGT